MRVLFILIFAVYFLPFCATMQTARSVSADRTAYDIEKRNRLAKQAADKGLKSNSIQDKNAAIHKLLNTLEANKKDTDKIVEQVKESEKSGIFWQKWGRVLAGGAVALLAIGAAGVFWLKKKS